MRRVWGRELCFILGTTFTRLQVETLVSSLVRHDKSRWAHYRSAPSQHFTVPLPVIIVRTPTSHDTYFSGKGEEIEWTAVSLHRRKPGYKNKTVQQHLGRVCVAGKNQTFSFCQNEPRLSRIKEKSHRATSTHVNICGPHPLRLSYPPPALRLNSDDVTIL